MNPFSSLQIRQERINHRQIRTCATHMRSVFNASIVSLGMALYFGTFKATNNSTNTLTETYELFMDKRDRAIVPIVITFQYHYSSHLHMSVLRPSKSATRVRQQYRLHQGHQEAQWPWLQSQRRCLRQSLQLR